MLNSTTIITPGIYRVKHDIEYPLLERTTRSTGYKPGKKLKGLPETRRLNGGSKGNVTLSEEWVDYLWRINTPKAFRYIQAPHKGWVNHGEDFTVEQLTFGGNLVEVIRVDGDKAFVKTYFNDQKAPLKIESMTLTQRFTVVYNDGHFAMSTDTKVGNAFTILIARPGEALWMNVHDLVKA